MAPVEPHFCLSSIVPEQYASLLSIALGGWRDYTSCVRVSEFVLVFPCTKGCVHAATLSSSFLKENCWVLTWQKTAGGACSEKCRLKLWLSTWKIWCGDHLLLLASGQWEQWFMNSLYLFGGLKWGQKCWCHCGWINIMNCVTSPCFSAKPTGSNHPTKKFQEWNLPDRRCKLGGP